MNEQQQAQRTRDIEALTKLWVSGMPTVPPPPTSQFELWFKLNQDDFGVVVYGVQECCKLYTRRRGVMDQDHAVRHASKVMNCLRRDRARGMFWRCHARLQAIQAGRVKRP